jgi:hypothetical protein
LSVGKENADIVPRKSRSRSLSRKELELHTREEDMLSKSFLTIAHRNPFVL